MLMNVLIQCFKAFHGGREGFGAPRSPEPRSDLTDKTQGFWLNRSGGLDCQMGVKWVCWGAGKTQGRPNLIDKTQGFQSRPEVGFGYPPLKKITKVIFSMIILLLFS